MRARRAIAAALLALIAGAAQAAETVRLGTEGAYPPFNFLTESGEVTGFERDLGDALCARAGLDCTWVITDWEAIIPGLLDQRYDAILAGMAVTPARQQQVAFSQPYTQGGGEAIFVGPAPANPDTARIAVQAETLHAEHLRARGLHVQAYPTMQAALDAVRRGEADLVFGGGSFLEPEVFRSAGALRIQGTEQIQSGGIAIAFRKQDSALRARFDKALDAMWADGSLAALTRKWFPLTEDT